MKPLIFALKCHKKTYIWHQITYFTSKTFFSYVQGYCALDMFKINQNGFIRALFGKSAAGYTLLKQATVYDVFHNFWIENLSYLINLDA